jgi:hypothetical protein
MSEAIASAERQEQGTPASEEYTATPNEFIYNSFGRPTSDFIP